MIGVVRAAQNRQLILIADQDIGTTAGNQSYVIPNGTQYIDIELYGGGGGGGAGNTVAAARVNYYIGGGGGGGGGYVHYGYTGAFGGDVLHFTIGSGGTGNPFSRGVSGGNTFLTSLERNEVNIMSFTNVVAYGGFGGERATTISTAARGGTGGVASGGNINNRNASGGGDGGLTSTVGSDGGNGGAGGGNDEDIAIGNLIANGGLGGFASSNTRATKGQNGVVALMGAGGGGGGYRNASAVSDAYKGATGGVGGIRIRSYG